MRKNSAAPVAGMAERPKAARKKRLSPKAYMPLAPCLSGPFVSAT